MWLTRSLEEMDLWKGRYMELKEERRRGDGDGWEFDEPKKSVRFKVENATEEDDYEEEGCPPSPVRSVLSVDDDGYYFGHDDAIHQATLTSTPSRPPPPPPPPPPRPADVPVSLSTPHKVATTKDDSATGTFFSPTVAGPVTSSSSSFHPKEDAVISMSKSTAIASGRAVLHRAAAALSSSSSPSPYKDGVALSPHPRKQAHDLLRKSAETRRLLRE